MTRRINLSTRHWVIAIALLALFFYIIFQARFLILGPRVWIDSPEQGEVLEDPILEITGRAKNIDWIELNGRQIFTDEDGAWNEKLILASGTSIMTVKVRDRFNRERTNTLEVILK